MGLKALTIANGKVNLTFIEAITRGILCNILVCLAVYLCFSGRSVTDKILAILFPITGFVALGFEHSIANMYFIPVGLLLKNSPEVLAATTEMLGHTPDLSNLTVYGMIVYNLVPVTIGNIIGGTIFVGIAHWFLYLRPAAVEPIRKMMTDGPPTISLGTSVAEVRARNDTLGIAGHWLEETYPRRSSLRTTRCGSRWPWSSSSCASSFAVRRLRTG